RVQADAIAEVQVDAGAGIEAIEPVHAAAVAAETILDVVTQAVPPSRRREHDARSLDPDIADEDEGVLNEDAHGVLRVGHVRLQRAPGGDGFLEGAAADPVAPVLGADE